MGRCIGGAWVAGGSDVVVVGDGVSVRPLAGHRGPVGLLTRRLVVGI